MNHLDGLQSRVHACPSEVIRAYARHIIDAGWLEDDDKLRRMLDDIVKRLTPKHTHVTPALEFRRMFRFVDAAVRTWASRELDDRNYTEEAQRLRDLQPITDTQTAHDATAAAAAAATATYFAIGAVNYAAIAAHSASANIASDAVYHAARVATSGHHATPADTKREAIRIILELATMTEEAPS